ncbi:MAG: DUF362 domain-containing protein [Deltaproteobacteria bacterium]|nr:DUF362 domain-containing protein [Deltaproteobacteria bacterium]
MRAETKAEVFFHNARSDSHKNRLAKLTELLAKSGLGSRVRPGDLVAVKLHWGEPGNAGYLPVPYARTIVEAIRQIGAKPFLTDTSTLYTGMRRNAVDNVQAAALNGFSLASLQAPVIVADGLCGRDAREVPIPSGTARIATGILDADAMVVLSHVKGHMIFGYAGALKNLGMGCTTPAGKQYLHSDLRPKVDPARCEGDAICVRRCPESCIEMVKGRGGKRVARIDAKRCIGCGECTAACPHGAIPIRWKTSPESIQRKTAEYALAALAGKRDQCLFVNLAIQVTPDCDCCDWNDPPFVPDVGLAASADPVALDVACADLVAASPPCPLSKADGCQGDPWRAVYDVDYRVIFEHAERIGLGSREYALRELSPVKG